jgi:competence protein ComEC
MGDGESSIHIGHSSKAKDCERVKKKRFFIILAVTFVIFLLTTQAMGAVQDSLQVAYINVGQGDSILIKDQQGFNALIDGGRSSAGPTVVAYLEQQGVSSLDVVVATHADSDHIGGLINVLKDAGIQVKAVYYSGYEGDTATWSEFATAVTEKGSTFQPAQYPQTYTWGDTTAHILNPAPGMVNPDSNDTSIVILLDHGDDHYLFTGDIDSTIEATIVARGTPVAAQVLKVAHHGSSASSSEAFLAAVDPQEAVISLGPNSYGHPAADTISRLIAAGAEIWRTDQSGTILFTDDGITYTVSTESSPTLGINLYTPILIYLGAPTPLPSVTLTPTATPAEPAKVKITNIYFDGAGIAEPDEYVEIQNEDTLPVQLQGWSLSDMSDHIFYFPAYLMPPSQICRVYTNEDHPEWCGFNYGSGEAIWNNTHDTATLRDGQGNLVSQYPY